MTEIGIVGAGPVGLTLACILQGNGHPVRVYEQQKHKPKISKAFAIHARTLELFRKIGVDEEVLKAGRAIRKMNLYSEKNRLGTLDFGHLSSEFPYFISIPQYQLEAILADRLNALGGQVEWGTAVNAIEVNDSAAGKIVLTTAGENSSSISHKYVVACDGAHSPTRKLLGVKFTGDTYDSEFLVVDARIKWSGNNYEAHTFLSRNGYLMVMPFPGLKHRIVTDIATGQFKTTPTLDEVHQLLRSKGFDNIQLSQPDWISATRYHKRLCNQFRVGNVFLAGDACHIHSPIGGQGLNTGLHDAFNLGWKLSAVLSGEAPAQLLDTYEIERRAIAQQVLANTDTMTKRFADKNPFKLALRKWLMPLVFSSPKVQKKIAQDASGIAIHYEKFTSVFNSPRAGKLRAGQRLPDVLVNHKGREQRLHRLLSDNRYSILVLSKSEHMHTELGMLMRLVSYYCAAPDVLFATSQAIAKSARHANIQMREECLQEYLTGDEAIVLVRADGYIAYASEKIDEQELKQVLDKNILPARSLEESTPNLAKSAPTQEKENRNEVVL